MLMGQTAENLAWKFGINRQQMDEFAVCSHQRATGGARGRAISKRSFRWSMASGKVYAEDDGVRADASMAMAWPSCARFRQEIRQHHRRQQLADHRWRGLAAARFGRGGQKWQLKPLGKIIDSQWAGLDPAQMGLGPVHAATPILQRHGLGLNDLDLPGN
jgi:acetyl-CoA C-acetyltransferase